MQFRDSWLGKRELSRVQYFRATPFPGKSPTPLPVRWRPFDDELLSSWLVRLAIGNGLTCRSMAKQALGLPNLGLLGIVDAYEKAGLLDLLVALSGISKLMLRNLTFYDVEWRAPGAIASADTIVYGEMVLRRAMLGAVGLRAHGAYRACIQCWQGDSSPYIRKVWRQYFTTVCPKHKIPLSPHCNRCGTSFNGSFAPYLSRTKYFQSELSVCRWCGFDVRNQATYSAAEWSFPKHIDPDAFRVFVDDADPIRYAEIEEIFSRSYEQGWFSIESARKLESLRIPHTAPWDLKFDGQYPELNKEWLGKGFQDFYERRISAWIQREIERNDFCGTSWPCGQHVIMPVP